jgi:hypothetical protein
LSRPVSAAQVSRKESVRYRETIIQLRRGHRLTLQRVAGCISLGSTKLGSSQANRSPFQVRVDKHDDCELQFFFERLDDICPGEWNTSEVSPKRVKRRQRRIL